MSTEFLKTLNQFSEGKIEVRALPSKKQAFFEINNLPGIFSFCKQNEKDHLYFGVATKDGQGGKKENIVNIPAFWADVDFKDTPREILSDRLSKFPFKPSIIVKSGGGVHLYWLLKQPATKEDIAALEGVNKRIVSVLGGDPKACDAAHILRIPDTINHKYPAKCEVSQINQYTYELNDFIEMLPEALNQTRQYKDVSSNGSDWLEKAMQGVEKGQRNATAAKLGGYYINKLPPKDVLTILQTWNQNNNPPLEDLDLETVVKSVSRYEPDKSQKRVDICHVYDAERMLTEYRNYIKDLKKNRFITGIGEIDKRIRGVAGGEVLAIVARAGSFKTATLQNLLKNYVNNSSWGAVFFSIEMPIASVTERYLEITQGCSGRDVEGFYQSKEAGVNEFISTLEKDFVKELQNLFVVPVKVGISDVAAYIKLIEQEFNVKIGVIGVDYLGLMDGHGVNEYEVITKLSQDTKTMAKMINLPVILLAQTSRKGGSGYTEITLADPRGSGAIEENCDFMLGLWQAEKEKGPQESIMNPEPEYDLICRILKNRKGSVMSTWKLDLDANTLRIGPEAEAYKVAKKYKSGGYDG